MRIEIKLMKKKWKNKRNEFTIIDWIRWLIIIRNASVMQFEAFVLMFICICIESYCNSIWCACNSIGWITSESEIKRKIYLFIAGLARNIREIQLQNLKH